MPNMPDMEEKMTGLVSEPVLSEAQRAALTEALMTNSFERDESSNSLTIKGIPPPLPIPKSSGSRGGSAPGSLQAAGSGSYKSKKELFHDHHLSRKGKGSGKPKKNGGGGRFTWGKLIDPFIFDSPDVATDHGDPNWDSEVEDECNLVEEITVQLLAYKKAVSNIIFEYFNSGDVEETASSLEEIDHPELGYYFVKRAVTHSLDRHDKEREMVSILLSSLYDKVIDDEQMRKGFESIVAELEELVLDVPHVVDLFSFFVCRAISDDILPPCFVKEAPCGTQVALNWQSRCSMYLSDPHFAERMSRVWGIKAGLELQDTQKAFSEAIHEYANSGDVEEMRRILHGLAVPYYHHELVKRIFMYLFEHEGTRDIMTRLLDQLFVSGDISDTQMLVGLQRISQNFRQIQIDNPESKEQFESVLNHALSQSWIDESTHTAMGMQVSGTVSHPETISLQDFKAKCTLLIQEYFDSGDMEVVAMDLNELHDPGFHSMFVKMLLRLAMDRNDREREMVSVLLAFLSQEDTISQEQMDLGFRKILAAAEDITLDIPEASRFLTLFLGRAVVDEVLSPVFLSDVASVSASSLGSRISNAVKHLITARHAAERFTTCWHGYSSEGTSAALSREFSSMIKEYSISKNFNEVLKCLSEMSMPHYHHDIVYRGILCILENPTSKQDVLELLTKLFNCGELNVTQVTTGYDRLLGDRDDLELDYVGARETLAVIGKYFTDIGMLSE